MGLQGIKIITFQLYMLLQIVVNRHGPLQIKIRSKPTTTEK